LGKAAMVILARIMTDSDAATNTQVKLVQHSLQYSMQVKARRVRATGVKNTADNIMDRRAN